MGRSISDRISYRNTKCVVVTNKPRNLLQNNEVVGRIGAIIVSVFRFCGDRLVESRTFTGVGAPKVVINVHQTYILNRTLDVHKRT